MYHLEDDACTVHVCVSAQQPQDLTHLPTSDHFDLELSKYSVRYIAVDQRRYEIINIPCDFGEPSDL